MTVTASHAQSNLIDLFDAAFEAFCDDMSSMFAIDVTSRRQHVQTGAARNAWNPTKKLSVTHRVQTTGKINGTLYLCFDQAGLFVLSGVVVMLPEARIVEQVKSGSAQDAANLQDAVREVGNLLVGSWDRVFREKCNGHGHFAKKSTFIGKPWEDPDGAALSPDEEVLASVYEVTAGLYPSFSCAIVGPKAMIDGSSRGSHDAAVEKPDAGEPAGTPAGSELPAPETPTASEVRPPVEAASSSRTSGASAAADSESQAAEHNALPADGGAKSDTRPAQGAQDPPAQTPAAGAVAQTAAASDDDQARWRQVVRESFESVEPRDMDQAGADSGGPCNGPAVSELLCVSARDIMTKDVVWADPEESVQQCIAKMQQQDCRYILVGRNGALDGIVSNSDIQGALSPYLRPVFAKWRRPEDDATLNIKIKWIMSRPVRTVAPMIPAAAMIETMLRHGVRCLPVIDGQTVAGIVTVSDILARLMQTDRASSWTGRPRQAPAVMI